jgi:hypothetical protein
MFQMDKPVLIEYLHLRRKVLLAELQIISNEISRCGVKEDMPVTSQNKAISELESEVVTIMKLGGIWKKKALAKVLYERNPNLKMDYRSLMSNLSSVFFKNPNIKSVKPWGWKFYKRIN